ncbi:type 4a pilus biogenesis protein PilO [Oceanisphaera psychrotolerans]|uniref:MSHA biogenesis protein MshJ n=1 Tax=Oceanisphaera psychrotolerans TaxID=1414654 RepID=A0A1J4QGL8_9GAMM|nr:type 4a pilus biogenesis protein PilO [Oceanisphaera psychrotolerans]OIN14008.1 MSHA biogenesis protein MshJ [Oceanisphaera psychrotolerans]
MSRLTLQLAEWRDRFMALSGRERWLILAASWALVIWLCLSVYEATLQAGVLRLEQERQGLNRQLDQQQQLRDELTQAIARLSNNDRNQQLERLNRRLNRLNENVDQRMRTLVGPEQMSALLLTILEQGQGLELRELSNQPPKLMSRDEGEEKLYRHDLSLHLSGSYMALLDYVQRLEQLSGRIFWRGLQFELEQYPEAIIRLDFFTISQHKELLRG